MKKWIAGLLIVCLAASLTACKERVEQAADSETTDIKTGQEDEGLSAPDEKAVSDGNILIAYFTWAENTKVEDPESVDVDATTSASVLPPGNTAKMAGWIQDRVGGDVFSIVVDEPYSSDYDECLDRAADEKAENARPKLVNHVENMEDYDVVFLGFPDVVEYHAHAGVHIFRGI